jgi:hypothetical protein
MSARKTMSPATTAPTFLRDALHWVRADRDIPEYTPNQRDVVARCAAAADQRVRCARDSSLYPPVATGLMRDAVGLLVRAVSVGREEHAPPVDTVAALAALRQSAGREVDEEDARRVADAIEASHPLYFDSMPREELTATYEALERDAMWLDSRVDLRSPTYRKGARVGRIGGLGIVAVWLLYALFRVAFPPTDLALNKPVKASSHQAGTPDPSGLVDGKIAPTFGFHTDVGQSNAWAIIDLERPTKIREIVVYNRSDHDSDDTLPYWLEISTDGTNYHEVARRAEHFGDGTWVAPAWTVSLHEYGRYVRIHSKRYLALNEIKVF